MKSKTIFWTLLTFSFAAATVPIVLLSNLEEGFPGPEWSESIPRLVVARDIKNKYRGADCLSKYFGDINWLEAKRKKSKNSSIPTFSSKNMDSCLTVEYYKQTYENKWWEGELRLVWSVTDGNNGLITTTNLKAYEGKLKLSSVAYILKKKGGSWTVTKASESDDEENKDVNKFSQKIPQLGVGIRDLPILTSYWGFGPITERNICKKGECGEVKVRPTTSSRTWHFSRNNGRTNFNMTSWCFGMNTWLEKAFGWKNLYDQLTKIKGTWALVKRTPDLRE